MFSLSLCVFAEDKTLNFLQPGKIAPVSKLCDTDNQFHSFPVSGAWNLVVYWSLFCHTCIEEMPVLQKKLDKPDFKNLKSFFISLDTVKMKNAVKNYLKKRKLQSTVLLEEIASDSYITADKWGVKMTPSVFIVSPGGIVKFSHEGPANMELMLNKLKSFMKIERKSYNCKSSINDK